MLLDFLCKCTEYIEEVKNKMKEQASKTKKLAEIIDNYSANHYHRFSDIVATRADGVWFWDADERKYLDMIATYSALNIGHNHPKIISCMRDALARGLPVMPHSVRTLAEAPFYRALCEFSHMEKVLPMNTGAEAFETAVKLARKWGYTQKGVESNKANIIVAHGNFHGRTLGALAASSNESHRANFGPFPEGFSSVPFGDARSIRDKIDSNTVAVLIEPIQGEGGVNIPPAGYLTEVKEVCREKGALFILDEIQTGFGRTGKNFAYEHEDAKPDVLIVAKSLGGGIYPVSAVLSSREIMDVFKPGDHGSTWGGNPYGCTVGLESINIIREEGLVASSAALGEYFKKQLTVVLKNSPRVKEIRGKGLLVGIELHSHAGSADMWCEKLLHAEGPIGLLCKGAGDKDQVIRFSPPLCITEEQIDTALDIIANVLL